MEQYQEAAKVLRNVRARKGSLRTLALGPHIKNKKFVYATVSETLKKQDVIGKVVEKAGLGKSLSKQVRDPHMLDVLLHDLLFGKGIQGGGSIKRLLKTHETALKAAAAAVLPAGTHATMEDEGGISSSSPSVKTCPIRYVRVNTLKLSVEEAIEGLVQRGGGGGQPQHKKKSSSSSSTHQQQSAIVPAPHHCYQRGEIELDPHIDGLLVLLGGRAMHDHPMVKDGSLVLQDKASCFPAHALLGPGAGYPGGDVIDACAAPGNKTAQLAASLASLSPSSRVLAMDRDPKRLGILKARVVGQMGATAVVPLLQDFLAVEPTDDLYKNVGIDSVERRVERQQQQHTGGRGGDQDGEGSTSSSSSSQKRKAAQRLRVLSEFQYKALTKAFSFPQVERVVYSTCSVHAEENEMVVSAALKAEQDKKKKARVDDYRPFVLRPTLESWPRRGMKQQQLQAEGSEQGARRTIDLDDQQLSCLVRADPKEDRTTGFFVAYFHRQQDDGDHGGGGGGGQGSSSSSKANKSSKKGRKRRREGEGQQQGGGDDDEEEDGGSCSGDGAHAASRTPSSSSPSALDEGHGRIPSGKTSRAAARRARRKKRKKARTLGHGDGGGGSDGE